MDSDSSICETSLSDEELLSDETKKHLEERKTLIENNQLLREISFKPVKDQLLRLTKIKFTKISGGKLVFNFTPSLYFHYISKDIVFYCTLKCIMNQYWIVRQNNAPARYKWKILDLFYDHEKFATTDNVLIDIILQIHSILLDWCLELEEDRLLRHKAIAVGQSINQFDAQKCGFSLNQDEKKKLFEKKEAIYQELSCSS